MRLLPNLKQHGMVLKMIHEAFAHPSTNGAARIRVLIADPNQSLQAVYRGTLSHEGFEVTAAFSGLECVARLREYVPDVLVLEPQLPWGGGEGVLAIMVGIPALATVPVVVLTACRDSRVMNPLARFPIRDYHLKPLAPDRLAGNLRTLLNRPKSRFTLAEQTGRLESSIEWRTGGRIRDLRVETVNGMVVVRGRTDSDHDRQLARTVVLEAFEGSEAQADKIELDIEVCSTMKNRRNHNGK